ncbi:Glycosyltransferase AglI [uncultured archaeon]|nr:Glycosyltransferase AglI [uncultured archaeon]
MKQQAGSAHFEMPVLMALITIATMGILFSLGIAVSAEGAMARLLAGSFAAMAFAFGIFCILSARFYRHSFLYAKNVPEAAGSAPWPLPTVAVAMPIYNEDPTATRKNIARLKKLKYAKGRINYYALDDSDVPAISAAIERACRDYGVAYLHRTKRAGFKAGAINWLLKSSSEQLIAIFDADEYLIDVNFLLDLVPYFGDKSIAFVQTEKKYAKGTFFSECVDTFYSVFSRSIQTSRAFLGKAQLKGSCCLIRRSAIEAIGGFPECVTEDMFFGLESDRNRFRSVCVQKVYALGKPVTTFTELVTQQRRYGYGGAQLMMSLFGRDIQQRSAVSKGTEVSKLDYATHGMGIFTSAFIAVFVLLSVLAVSAHAAALEVMGFLAIVCTAIVSVILTQSFSKGILIWRFNFALVSTRLGSALAALLGMTPREMWYKDAAGPAANGIYHALHASAAEFSFAAVLLAAGIFSALAHDLLGAAWLFTYSLLFGSSTAFFLKYG